MKIFRRKITYLDYASVAPINKDALKIMRLYESKFFANPGAIHNDGVEARNAAENARQEIASLINAHSDEIIFTGSGTESDALAILGVVRAYKSENIPHIITTNIEHSAVLENCRLLEKNKEAEVTYVEVNKNGIVNPKDIRDALKENTVLVSVMYANNEIGTIEPLQEIAKEIRHFRKINCGECKFLGACELDGVNSEKISSKKFSCPKNLHSPQYPLFHTDACQAMNYLYAENIEKLGVDLLSFNGSKIYGPKGVGVLYKKRGIELAPLYAGGGQEFGFRSGTENVASIAGLAEAFKKTCLIKEKESARLIAIRDYGIKKLFELSEKSGYEIILNGDKIERLPNNINISIIGISSELLVIELDAKGIEVSERSACGSDNDNGSHVIRAIRKNESYRSKASVNTDSLRISLGRQTTKKDMDFLVLTLTKILNKYKQFKK
ncbi:MAG TPA: cysteine desulfurase family protein [Candidatus Paceibacterota bacterium]|nr:cysteine desulfurase family protein [Candidatus Paceibacterota bacterium]